jgi:hypothetical protein
MHGITILGECMKIEKRHLILLMIFCICLTAFSPLSIINICYAQNPRIYLDPSSNIFYSNVTSVGYRFNLTVWCENVPDLGGAQIYLEFNDSIINVTRWFVPSGDPYFFMPEPPPATALPTPPDPGYIHVAPGKGYVKVSVSKGGLPPGPPWGHSGKIAIFEFVITAMPPEDGQLTCPLHINTTDTFLLDPNAEKVSNVIKEDGTYTFIYVAPPPHVPQIWLEASPSTYEAIKMRPFNVSVIIQNVSSLDYLIGVQLILSYNSTCLDVVDIFEGDFLKNPTWAPYGAIATYYVDHRGVIYGQFILSDGSGQWNPPFPEGNGTIATITFLPTLHEAANFNITIEPLFGRFFLNKTGEWMPHLPPKNCEYTYSPLPLPTLAVAPNTYIASHIGEIFDINVTLNDIDALWNMTYAEFKLYFDHNSLQVIDVIEGDFLSQFGSTVFNHEENDGYTKVNITLTPVGNYPSGSGTLATVRFNVTSSPGTSTLTLNDTKLLDSEMKDVLHETQDGYYQLHERLIHPITWETETFNIITVSNTSITPVPMNFNQTYKLLWFNVTGYDGTVGFVNITIPKALLNASITDWYVIVGGWPVQPIVLENATHTTLYFTFSSSVNSVYILGTWVVPEMSTSFLLLALLMISLAGFAFAKKVQLKKCKELLISRILFKSA